MKKFLLSAAVAVAFIGYSVHQRLESGDGPNVVAPVGVTQITPTPASQLGVVGTKTATYAPASSPTATPSSAQMPGMGMMGSGTYTGDTVDAYYGYVQVQVTTAGGKISDVKFLQYPSDRSTSIQINKVAMPYLVQEAIAAQSANVNIISGATFTSKAFRQSLQSALDKIPG